MFCAAQRLWRQDSSRLYVGATALVAVAPTEEPRSAPCEYTRIQERHVSRVAISLMLFAALVVPAAAQNFDAETFVLDNGMRVVVVPNYRVPAVTQMVWYK